MSICNMKRKSKSNEHYWTANFSRALRFLPKYRYLPYDDFPNPKNIPGKQNALQEQSDGLHAAVGAMRIVKSRFSSKWPIQIIKSKHQKKHTIKKLKHYKTHENRSKMKDFEVNFTTKTTNVYKPLTFDINTVSTYVNSFCWNWYNFSSTIQK